MNGLIDKYGLEKTFVNHLIPFLDRIGIMWLIGSINPSQEHFMSNLIRQKIISEIDKQPIPKEDSKSILMYLPEHEWHEISLAVLSVFIEVKRRSYCIFRAKFTVSCTARKVLKN